MGFDGDFNRRIIQTFFIDFNSFEWYMGMCCYFEVFIIVIINSFRT